MAWTRLDVAKRKGSTEEEYREGVARRLMQEAARTPFWTRQGRLTFVLLCLNVAAEASCHDDIWMENRIETGPDGLTGLRFDNLSSSQ